MKKACPIVCSLSYKNSILVLITSSIFATFNPSTKSPSRAPVSGIISTNRKRLRSAVSINAIERSAVFIVPKICTLAGTLNTSPEYGSIADAASGMSFLFVSSIKVINSPKILEIFPLLISSMINTLFFCSASAFSIMLYFLTSRSIMA